MGRIFPFVLQLPNGGLPMGIHWIEYGHVVAPRGDLSLTIE
jgi:hypothetical protein